MKIIAPVFFGVLSLCHRPAYMVLVSDEAGELPPMTETKLYVSGEFRSEVCRSPDLSPLAPYWEFNGTTLNDNEINAYYGAIVDRNISAEGDYLSTLTILSVDLTMNATVISCLVNRTVILQYHVIVVEAELLYLSTEEFHSTLCVSPLVSSPAPYFMYNDIILNNDEVNKFYRANIIRNYSIDGHYQAMMVIAALGGSTLDDSRVTCLVNSTVIWSVRLIIRSRDNLTTTTAAVGTVATSDHHDGIIQTTSMPGLPKSAGLSEVAIAPIVCVPLTVLGGVVITVTIALVVIYKRWKCRKAKRLVDNSNNGEPPDQNDADRQPIPASSQSPTTPAVPQVPNPESVQKTVVATQPMVTGMSRRTQRHERVSSLLRYCDGIPCSVSDPKDLPALNATTLTHIHSFGIGENESELLAAAAVPTGREEQSKGEGESLAVPCINGIDCKNVYNSFYKVWQKSTGSSQQCQSVASEISDEYNNGTMVEDGTVV